MKLPDVQYGGTPGVGNAPSPQQAVSEYAQKQNILQKAQSAANEISLAAREYNVTKADNAYADEMATFRKEAAKKSVLTPGEVAALDIDVDTEGKEYIPKSEWYPKLLAKRMDEYRGKHAATIQSPIDRQKWTGEIAKNDNKILEREIEVAAEESRKFLVVQKLTDAENALNAGYWISARNALAGKDFSASPELEAKRNDMLAKIDLAEGQESIRDKVDTIGNNPAALRQYADYLRTDEANDVLPLTADQLASESGRINSLAKTVESELKTNDTKAYNDGVDAYWQKNWDNPSAMINNMPAGLKKEDITAIVNWADKRAKGETIVTNPASWTNLNEMSKNPAEADKFRELNLNQYKDKLSTKDMRTMQDRQIELKEVFDGKKDAAVYLNDGSILDSGTLALGITNGNTPAAPDYQKQQQIQALYNEQFQQAAKEKQRALTVAEKQEIVRQMNTSTQIKDIAWYGGSTTEAVTLADLKPEQLVLYPVQLRTIGIDVTPESMSIIRKLEQENIDITRQTYDAAKSLHDTGKVINKANMRGVN